MQSNSAGGGGYGLRAMDEVGQGGLQGGKVDGLLEEHVDAGLQALGLREGERRKSGAEGRGLFNPQGCHPPAAGPALRPPCRPVGWKPVKVCCVGLGKVYATRELCVFFTTFLYLF